MLMRSYIFYYIICMTVPFFSCVGTQAARRRRLATLEATRIQNFLY